MTENHHILPEGTLSKSPRPSDRETRFLAPRETLLIRQKEENA